MKNVIIAAMAWKATRLVQVGASAVKTPVSARQTDSSSMPFMRSNSGPKTNDPTTVDTPITM